MFGNESFISAICFSKFSGVRYQIEFLIEKMKSIMCFVNLDPAGGRLEETLIRISKLLAPTPPSPETRSDIKKISKVIEN